MKSWLHPCKPGFQRWFYMMRPSTDVTSLKVLCQIFCDSLPVRLPSLPCLGTWHLPGCLCWTWLHRWSVLVWGGMSLCSSCHRLHPQGWTQAPSLCPPRCPGGEQLSLQLLSLCPFLAPSLSPFHSHCSQMATYWEKRFLSEGCCSLPIA